MRGDKNGKVKWTGVGARIWGGEWDTSGKEVYVDALTTFLKEDVEPTMQLADVFLGFFFEIAGCFKEITESKVGLRYEASHKWLSCSITVSNKDVALAESDFRQLIIGWIRGLIPRIIERLKSKGIEMDFEAMEQGILRVCDRLKEVRSIPNNRTQEMIEEVAKRLTDETS